MTRRSAYEGMLDGVRRKPVLRPRLALIDARMRPVAYVLLGIDFGLTMPTHGLPKHLHDARGFMADPVASAADLIAHDLDLLSAPHLAGSVTELETFGRLEIALWSLTRLVVSMSACSRLPCPESLVLGLTWPGPIEASNTR